MATHERPRFEQFSHELSGIRSVVQERPSKYMMLMSFAQEILREESHLSATDREIIAAYTSRLNGCEFCCGSHTAFAASIGAGATDLTMIESGNTNGHRLAPLLAYVKKLTLTPSEISDSDKQAVHDGGFSEEELKDAIAVCAGFNLFNRLVEGHGIGPHKNYQEATEMINAHGYDRRR